MKIAIHNSYGVYEFPKGFDTKREFTLKVREELAEFFENHYELKVTHEDVYHPTKMRNNIAKSRSDVIKYVRDDAEQYIVADFERTGKRMDFWQVVNLDTTKLWQISEVDGCESLDYYKVGKFNELIRQGE